MKINDSFSEHFYPQKNSGDFTSWPQSITAETNGGIAASRERKEVVGGSDPEGCVQQTGGLGVLNEVSHNLSTFLNGINVKIFEVN